MTTEEIKEKAVIVGLITRESGEDKVKEYLDELAFLIDTAGAESLKKFTQKLDIQNSKTYVGTGKLKEIAAYISINKIDMAVFDDELSPSQIRNLGQSLKCKILDRNNLILDIFAKRARTSHAKTQVELAQYEYLLPRLTGLWTHLERQKGGIGLRGPGEREIETDRRIIRDKIALLKKKLKKIDKQKVTQRKSRESMIRAAIVGYTNVGKSTIMNLISKSDVFIEDKLFATLDTTVRKVVVGNLPFLVTDTVGFIRKLPHSLIEACKSTLDEVRDADLLIHVADISHPYFEEHINTVNQTLDDIGANNKPTILVFNKIDNFTYIMKDPDDLTPSGRENLSLKDLKSTWMAKNNYHTLFISAKKKQNINEFKKLLYDEIKKLHIKRYPYDNFLFDSEELFTT
ncbi:MAG: GTPase HflX [Bacteroidales bacterium]|nr:GTPase HflX [Bacteroidales bacterium]